MLGSSGEWVRPLGNVSGGNVQIGDYNQIEAQLKTAKVPAGERAKLKQLMDALPRASLSEKPNIVERGVTWTVRHAASLGVLSHSIREWFQK